MFVYYLSTTLYFPARNIGLLFVQKQRYACRYKTIKYLNLSVRGIFMT